MRIRQLALVARELELVVSDLLAVFGLEISLRDPGVGLFGLHNAVMPVGTQFLEVVSPVKEGTTAGRYLDRRGGDGGYMVILQSDDLGADRRRMAEQGVRIVWETTLDDIATIHLHPRDVGGAIVSLDQPRPPSAWRWGGPDWEKKTRTDVVRAISSATIQAADPERMAARYTELFNLPAPSARGDGLEIRLDQETLRFVDARDGRGDGLAAIGLAAVDAERAFRTARERALDVTDSAIGIGGVRFELVPSR